MKALLLASLAMRLSAATLQMTGTGLGRTDVAMVSQTGDSRTIHAVEIDVTVDGTPYVAYCVDIFTDIWLGSFGNTMGAPSSIGNGERTAWLLEQFAGLVSTNDEAATLQLAMWDVAHDGGDGFAGGVIQLGATETALRDAANLLVQASVGQSSPEATIHYNVDLADGTRRQTLMTAVVVSSPEPGTAAMIGLGMAGLAMAGKRRAAQA